MKIPSSYHNSNQIKDSAMTPMIDVVFLLLIFFVCASAVPIAETIISSPLKKVEAEQASVPIIKKEEKLAKVVIKRIENGMLEYEFSIGQDVPDKFKTIQELENYFKSRKKTFSETSVVLDIGTAVTMKTTLQVYDICDQYGFQKTSFGVREVSKDSRK